MNSNSSVNSIGYIGIRKRNANTTALTSAVGIDIGEIPNMRYKMINVSTGMGNWPVISMRANIASLLGIKDLKDDDDAAALHSANPTDLCYYDVFYMPRDEATTASMLCDIEIHYVVQFFDQNLTIAS